MSKLYGTLKGRGEKPKTCTGDKELEARLIYSLDGAEGRFDVYLKHLGDSVELSVYFEDNYLYTCVSSCRVVGGKNGKDALMVLTREGWEPFDFLF